MNDPCQLCFNSRAYPPGHVCGNPACPIADAAYKRAESNLGLHAVLYSERFTTNVKLRHAERELALLKDKQQAFISALVSLIDACTRDDT